MNLRDTLMFGMAAASLVLALPSQASPGYGDSAYLIAQRNVDDSRRNRQESTRDERKPTWGDSGRDDPQGYGYGWERRQREYGSGEPVQQERESKRRNPGGRR